MHTNTDRNTHTHIITHTQTKTQTQTHTHTAAQIRTSCDARSFFRCWSSGASLRLVCEDRRHADPSPGSQVLRVDPSLAHRLRRVRLGSRALLRRRGLGCAANNGLLQLLPSARHLARRGLHLILALQLRSRRLPRGPLALVAAWTSASRVARGTLRRDVHRNPIDLGPHVRWAPNVLKRPILNRHGDPIAQLVQLPASDNVPT